MLNITANPLFHRAPRIVNEEHAKYIVINYKPKNYWVDDAVTMRIEFMRLSNRGVAPSGYECEGNMVTFDVRYSGGGQDSGASIDPIETIENFRAALGDAISIVNHVKERIKAGASFLEICGELAAIDLPVQPKDDTMPIVIVHIGDSVVASKGLLFANAEIAKQRLNTLYGGQTIQFEEREANQNEASYWWFNINAKLKNVICD